ncbi:hypothetical protein ACFWNQ_39220 [Streptomyces virginiae]|uniref:hypothetical protein n=1 Tax=Streptomyces virginiae TaxID=1961 RepID=UPI0036630175
MTLVTAMISSQMCVPGEERIQDRSGLDGSGSVCSARAHARFLESVADALEG